LANHVNHIDLNDEGLLLTCGGPRRTIVAFRLEKIPMPDIAAQLEGKKYLVITPDDLEKILAEAELVDEIDTRLNKTIRLLRFQNRLLLQEYSFDGDIIVRPMDSPEAADALVQSRLDTYDRMWDGCGCKVDFFE
jgi:hypothetical protein